MSKYIVAVFLIVVILSGCAPTQAAPAPTAEQTAASTGTPLPPTSTPLPTATATPLPLPISAKNFDDLQLVSTSTLDQTVFVGFSLEKIGFFEDKANIPDGEVKSAYFESYRWLENGDLVGVLQYLPLDCGERQFGNETRRSCSYNRYYQSMVNLSKRTSLWKQFFPVNMAGSELNRLVDELGIKNFRPKPLFTNRGYVTDEWSNDSKIITVPIQVVDSTLVKDVLTGKNLYVYPWGASASWIASISPDGKKFATIVGGPTGGPDSLQILDMASGKVEDHFTVSGMATDLAWSKDGSKVAVGTRLGFVVVFEPATKAATILKERRFDVENEWKGGIFRLKFADDGDSLACTERLETKSGEIISRFVLFDLESKKEVNAFPADFYQPGEVAWDKDGRFAVTVTDVADARLVLLSADGTAEVPLDTPVEAADYKAKIFTSLVTFNPDQTRLTLVRSLFNDARIEEFEIRR